MVVVVRPPACSLLGCEGVQWWGRPSLSYALVRVTVVRLLVSSACVQAMVCGCGRWVWLASGKQCLCSTVGVVSDLVVPF